MPSKEATGGRCYVVICNEKIGSTRKKYFSEYPRLFHNIRTTYTLLPLALFKVTFQATLIMQKLLTMVERYCMIKIPMT